MTIAFKVSAQELLNAGAPLTAIRQSYRPHDAYSEKVAEKKVLEGYATTDAQVYYEAIGSARDNFFYTLPAKGANGAAVASISSDATKEVVWGGSIKDSYVLVTEV
jgi:hypothetical protein